MITSQKNALENARRSQEDALKATKIKSNFLASMSHELRTPFSSFYGLLDLLSGTELSPGQSDIVQTAKQSCELLLRIIDSILDYSKLEASALKLEFSGFSVENVLADCMELLLPMAATKLDLSYNIEPNVPPWVFSDYARIRQVLMNLIGNAVKFTSQGSVCVVCSLEGFGPSPDEVHLKFVTRDTGIGLSASDIDLLFVPFQQADNSSTRRFGGTGLGLSISRQLVQLMGGAIGVESELNVGSIFWFTLPVKIFSSEDSRKSMMSIENLRSLLLHPNPLRVIICSPSEATVSLLSTMLKGFHLASFASIHDVEIFLQDPTACEQPLDFIILDHQSEVQADELAATLNALQTSAFANTKIIHLYTPTAKAHSGSGSSMFKSNTPGVIRMTKPPRTARLLQALADVKKLPSFVPGPETMANALNAVDPSGSARRLYGNILVAEDNQVARQLLVKQLERYQLKVTATTNGKEALEEWKAHEPGYFSLAMFDHHMPVCDGVEAAKRLRVMETEMNLPITLPIVALSADCQQSTMQLCLSAGMTAFFSKPLKKNDLLQLLAMFGSGTSPTS
jgi:CheY-like chemotaxis protein/nitrogen-specific signal transduction histidine kinase